MTFDERQEKLDEIEAQLWDLRASKTRLRETVVQAAQAFEQAATETPTGVTTETTELLNAVRALNADEHLEAQLRLHQQRLMQFPVDPESI